MFYTFPALVRHAVFVHQKMECSISSQGISQYVHFVPKKWVSPFHLVVFYTVPMCWHCPHCACAQKNGLSHFTTLCFARTVFLCSLGRLSILSTCHAYDPAWSPQLFLGEEFTERSIPSCGSLRWGRSNHTLISVFESNEIWKVTIRSEACVYPPRKREV